MALILAFDATGTGELVAGVTARPSYTASWQDGVGRTIASAVYGNLGDDSAVFTRPDSPPASTDTVLVSQTVYNAGGQVQDVIDPMGQVNRTLFDNAGRPDCQISNYVAGEGNTSCGNQSCGDQNVTVKTTYNADGNTLTLVAMNQDTGHQTTSYLYGTTLADSDIASNNLLRATIYPDAGDGDDQVTMTFNRLGEVKTRTDQNGTVHEYEQDALGRQKADKVTTLAAGIDGSVLRIQTGYEVRGMTDLITSYDNAAGIGTPVNQVKLTYNDFGQLQTDSQEHDGAVDGNTPAVNYGYVDGTGNSIRPTSMTYPDGCVLAYQYGTSGSDDDKLSRVAVLNWNGSDVASYTYLGVAGIVKETYPVPTVSLDYIGSGNNYSGFDRFSRIVDQNWTSSSGVIDRFTYGYDRASNRTYRKNVVATNQTVPVYLDENYLYDGLDRLTASNRGQVVDDDRVTLPSLAQAWKLDATGNWQQFSNFDQSDSTGTLIQQRSHNAANEITDVGETVGAQWAAPAQDRNGSMTSLPSPSDPTVRVSVIYDAWNRVVEVQNNSIATLGAYSYDGLNRRIRKFVPGSPDGYQHFYYTASSQVVETRESANSSVPATPQYQYVWSLRYIDAPVLRDDRAADPDEVIYFSGDANFNITSLVDNSGNPLERYVYTPYGSLTVFTGDWSGLRSSSDYDNSYAFTGRRLDSETGLYFFRARYYHAQLGRFISRDPVNYFGGLNLYRSYFVLGRLDPSGSFPIDNLLSKGFWNWWNSGNSAPSFSAPVPPVQTPNLATPKAPDPSCPKRRTEVTELIPSGEPSDEPLDVQISTIKDGLMIGECGGFDWEVIFRLSEKSPDHGGYLLQHLKIQVRANNCDGSKNEHKDIEYWEAFKFPGDSVVTKAGLFSSLGSKKSADDHFLGRDYGSCTEGTIAFDGEIVFVPGAIPDVFQLFDPEKGVGVPQARLLPATARNPRIVEPGKPISSYSNKHAIHVKWNCCKD